MKHSLAAVALISLCALSCQEREGPNELHDAEHLSPTAVLAQPAIAEEIYVPVYSSLAFAEGREIVELSAQLAIHNTDAKHSIVIDAVQYFDGAGKKLRDEIEQAQRLDPLATTTFFIRRRDKDGGKGANFLVRWSSAEPVSHPLVESVMADLSSSSALAFTTRGVTTKRAEGQKLD